MSGVIVDIVVVLVIVSLAAFGYRSGVLKAGSAMVGLLIGLAVAIPTASAVGRQIDSTAWRLGVVVGLLVLISNPGYVAGMRVGEKLKARVRRPLARGLDQAITRHSADGRPVLGVCGGFQMLGRTIDDPDDVEGHGHVSVDALGLLGPGLVGEAPVGPQLGEDDEVVPALLTHQRDDALDTVGEQLLVAVGDLDECDLHDCISLSCTGCERSVGRAPPRDPLSRSPDRYAL